MRDRPPAFFLSALRAAPQASNEPRPKRAPAVGALSPPDNQLQSFIPLPPPRRKVRARRSRALGQQLGQHFSVHIGEAEVAALETEGQLEMIQAQQMQD